MSQDGERPERAEQAGQAEQAEQTVEAEPMGQDEASKRAHAAEVLKRNVERSRELLEARKRRQGGRGHHDEEEGEEAGGAPRPPVARGGGQKGRGSNFKVGRRGG